jgi:hypothetical protein
MSRLGRERTSRGEFAMSASPLKAEIGARNHLDFIGSAWSNPRRVWARFVIRVWNA